MALGVKRALVLATGAALVIGWASACNAITGADDLHATGGGGAGGASSGQGSTHTTGAGSAGPSTGPGAGGQASGTASANGGASTGPGTCSGVDCGAHGTCVATTGQATCSCDPGYHAMALSCVVDETCTSTTCGNCASCDVVGGIAQCSCPMGYVLMGNGCVLSPDPCDTTTCGSGQACVSEAHCQPLGACVDTCDCSNCPNCGPDNSDGRWDDEQEYCGAQPNQSPATMVCNKPCSGGEGCLPYQTQICWPLEGCFSL